MGDLDADKCRMPSFRTTYLDYRDNRRAGLTKSMVFGFDRSLVGKRATLIIGYKSFKTEGGVIDVSGIMYITTKTLIDDGASARLVFRLNDEFAGHEVLVVVA